MRYSDDFIFIVLTEEGFEEGRDEFSRLAGTMPSLKIHPRKAHSFRMVDREVYLLDSEDEPKCAIDYLGFSFNGTSVRLWQRTIGRFYRRMYRRIGRLYKCKFRSGKNESIHSVWSTVIGAVSLREMPKCASGLGRAEVEETF